MKEEDKYYSARNTSRNQSTSTESEELREPVVDGFLLERHLGSLPPEPPDFSHVPVLQRSGDHAPHPLELENRGRSMQFALSAALTDKTLTGGIVAVAIVDHYHPLAGMGPIPVDWTLQRFRELNNYQGRPYAPRLHEYLKIEEDFHQWMTRLNKTLLYS